MKAILMSIKAEHNRNIESGAKTSELRIRPPKIKPPFKVYTYESGFDGRQKVVNEWICDSVETWRICMGVPAHLPIRACVSVAEIKEYSGKKYRDVAEMRITNLKIYDKPKELSALKKSCDKFLDCIACKRKRRDEIGSCNASLIRPPQSWQYCEELEAV